MPTGLDNLKHIHAKITCNLHRQRKFEFTVCRWFAHQLNDYPSTNAAASFVHGEAIECTRALLS